MNSARCIVLLIIATITVGTTPLAADSATTHRVRQDGSGDFTTIGAAVAAAVAGDVIEVGPGTYPEQVDVYVTLSFTSTDGAAATIVDGENTHYPLWFRGGTGHSVDGFTFRRGYHATGGGAIRCQAGATLTIRNSVIEDNVSDFDGGGFFTRDPGSMIESYDCVFSNNRAAKNGGASIAILNSTMRFTRCTFIGNIGVLGAGATAADHSRLDITECLYVDNDASIAGAVYAYVSTGDLVSNTFYSSRSETWGSVLLQASPSMSVTRSIFYGEELTVGLAFLTSVASHSCNVFFENAAGSIVNANLAASEVVQDPLFCDAANGDFTISVQSPAAPANNACDQLIGARPTNCDIAPPPPPRPAKAWYVEQDGSGDFTTVGAAVGESIAGDSLIVGPGTYAEQVDVYHKLTFLSTDGAAATIMDGETTHYPLWFRGGAGSLVDGFTFRRGYHVSGGGAIRCQAGATLTMRNCVMEDNVSDFDGGALFTRDAGSMIEAYDCTFIGNQAAKNGGASIAILSSTMRFTRCSFINNTGGLGAGATAVDHSRLDITECLYVDNDATTAGAIYAYVSTGSVTSSTFYSSSSEIWGSVLMQDSPDIALTRNIFYGEEQTVGLAFYAFNLPYVGNAHTCNVFFNNAGGAMSGADLDASEVVLDPVFCDAANGDFTISLQSPAAPANSPCGELIGAFPTSCNIPPPPPPPPPVVEPVILSILDVPDDEGRQVRIRWERADYDALNQPYVITGYAIYRYQGNAAAPLSMPSLAGERGERMPHLDGWDYIATVPARGDDIYQVVAPTLCDTPKNGDPCWSHFFVSAMTPNPLVYFDSAPDSGYSVDNTPPAPPNGVVVQASPGGNDIVWEPSESQDVVLYQVYRATNQVPEPTEDYLVYSTSGTEWVDPSAGPGAVYAVVAVDRNGNESDAVTQGSATGVGGTIPARMYLAQNAPNPFNPATTIEFGVAAGGGHVTMDIFDVAGRRIRALLSEPRAAGVWQSPGMA